MTTLFLVQGDTGPQVQVDLTRADTGLAVSCQNANCTMKVRVRGASATLFTITANDTGSNLEDGKLIFSFGNNLLSIAAGAYEGEVNVVFSDGSIETVYETVDFVAREDFT